MTAAGISPDRVCQHARARGLLPCAQPHFAEAHRFMCGIAGGVLPDSAFDLASAEPLRRMSQHMRARCPDGSGLWIARSGRAALAHRRLSIIDLSDRAAQPMVADDGRLAITFNGEIYNHVELRAELEAKGRSFETSS